MNLYFIHNLLVFRFILYLIIIQVELVKLNQVIQKILLLIINILPLYR